MTHNELLYNTLYSPCNTVTDLAFSATVTLLALRNTEHKINIMGGV